MMFRARICDFYLHSSSIWLLRPRLMKINLRLRVLVSGCTDAASPLDPPCCSFNIKSSKDQHITETLPKFEAAGEQLRHHNPKCSHSCIQGLIPVCVLNLFFPLLNLHPSFSILSYPPSPLLLLPSPQHCFVDISWEGMNVSLLV